MRTVIFVIHLILGYAAVFVLVPTLLIYRKDSSVHKKIGDYYTYIMLFLFFTGLYFLFNNDHPFGYHLIMTFNFVIVGIYFVLIGRSMVGETLLPRFLRKYKNILSSLALFSSLVLFFIGWFPDTIDYYTPFDIPIIIFGFFGVILTGIQFKKVRLKVFKGKEPSIVREHIFYMLLSYLFLLTSLTITAFNQVSVHEGRYFGVALVGLPALLILLMPTRKNE